MQAGYSVPIRMYRVSIAQIVTIGLARGLQ